MRYYLFISFFFFLILKKKSIKATSRTTRNISQWLVGAKSLNFTTHNLENGFASSSLQTHYQPPFLFYPSLPPISPPYPVANLSQTQILQPQETPPLQILHSPACCYGLFRLPHVPRIQRPSIPPSTTRRKIHCVFVFIFVLNLAP